MTRSELPTSFTVGDTVEWTETDSEYPQPTWTVRYYFTSPEEVFSSAVSTANGEDHDLTIDTTDLEPGTYDYQRKVTDGSDTFTTERGTVTVLPNLADDAAGVDRRQYAETALANIEAMLAGKATKDQTSYSLNGRALSRYSPSELNEWRQSLRLEVADLKRQERRERGGKSHNNVRLRFTAGRAL